MEGIAPKRSQMWVRLREVTASGLARGGPLVGLVATLRGVSAATAAPPEALVALAWDLAKAIKN